MKPTPRPWKRDGYQVNGKEHIVYIVGGGLGEHPTIFISSMICSRKDREEFEANIELILERVNAK